MNSLVSANGPSTTLRWPPLSVTREPALLGIRPALSSIAPAAVASAPSFMIAAIRDAGGGPAGRFPLSRTIYRTIDLLLVSFRAAWLAAVGYGRPGRAERYRSTATTLTQVHRATTAPP